MPFGIPFRAKWSQSPFGDNSGLPYLGHPKLFVWNCTDRDLNGTTVSSVPEMARGASHAWSQPIAASQPIATADGIEFPLDKTRTMDLVPGAVPLNGSTGIYSAVLVKLDAAAAAPQRLLKIYDGGNPARPGRLRLNFQNSADRSLQSFITQVDNNTSVLRIDPTSIVTRGTWYLLEHFHDFAAAAPDPAAFWQDGVSAADNLANAFAATAYPTTDSLGGLLGETFTGEVGALAIFAGGIPNDVHTSVAGWMLGEKP